MGNSHSYPRTRHVALLGDSTIDNGNWVAPGEPCVTDQVAKLFSGQTTCAAKDGALMAAIADQALAIPPSATHVVVSVGGNNAISAVNLLKEPVASAEEALLRLHKFAREFEAELEQTIQNLITVVGTGKSVIVCSIYNPCFRPFNVTTVTQETSNLCVALLHDACVRVATRFGLPVIDWRRVCTRREDFANPIEPSSAGGQKMAEAIVSVIEKHPFDLGHTVVYPQSFPQSELTRADDKLPGPMTRSNVLDDANSSEVAAEIRQAAD